MADIKDKSLSLIAHELKFIRRQIQQVEGAGRSDFEIVDEVGMAVESALQALEEYELSLQPDATDELSLPEVA